jgi:hypothetical protein
MIKDRSSHFSYSFKCAISPFLNGLADGSSRKNLSFSLAVVGLLAKEQFYADEQDTRKLQKSPDLADLEALIAIHFALGVP